MRKVDNSPAGIMRWIVQSEEAADRHTKRYQVRVQEQVGHPHGICAMSYNSLVFWNEYRAALRGVLEGIKQTALSTTEEILPTLNGCLIAQITLLHSLASDEPRSSEIERAARQIQIKARAKLVEEFSRKLKRHW